MKRLLIAGLLLVVGCAKKQVIKPEVIESPTAVTAQKIEQETARPENQTVELEAVYFDFDSYDFRVDTLQLLYENGIKLLQTDKSIFIEGHCDSRGSVEYNDKLGLYRAMAVKSFYVNMGIDHERISIHSYSKLKPISQIHKLNRRVETR